MLAFSELVFPEHQIDCWSVSSAYEEENTRSVIELAVALT